MCEKEMIWDTEIRLWMHRLYINIPTFLHGREMVWQARKLALKLNVDVVDICSPFPMFGSSCESACVCTFKRALRVWSVHARCRWAPASVSGREAERQEAWQMEGGVAHWFPWRHLQVRFESRSRVFDSGSINKMQVSCTQQSIITRFFFPIASFSVGSDFPFYLFLW